MIYEMKNGDVVDLSMVKAVGIVQQEAYFFIYCELAKEMMCWGWQNTRDENGWIKCFSHEDAEFVRNDLISEWKRYKDQNSQKVS